MRATGVRLIGGTVAPNFGVELFINGDSVPSFGFAAVARMAGSYGTVAVTSAL